MDTKHWTSLNTILDRALELPPGERIAFIENDPALSDEMRQEAISFLKSIHKSDTLWDKLIESSSELIDQINKEDRLPVAEDQSPPPQQIGPYKILEKLASGGMGTVYRADRTDGHLQITVAIKLLRRECIDSHHIHQFNIERNVLGKLNHPHIARIYDGGITETGRPYLVMEYVEGVPVTDYCRSRECSVEQKLMLFEQICEGVNFAHSNLVVHRDLKPDNIFVTSDGNCKILDFGIAKIIDPDGISISSDEDAAGLNPFSIQHAAPEQLCGEAITTSTDVYALGLLLYELLTTTFPFNLDGKSPREAIQIISNSTPPRASYRAKDNSTTVRLRGDLDDILQEALRRNPAERYQSAGDLLSDIRNYRQNIPISIKRDQQFYKLKKFTVRNSGIISGLAVILIILTGMTFYYIDTIKSERQKAMAEEQQASFIAGFMVDLFDASDPENNISDTLTVYDILQSGLEKLDNWEASELSKADIMISLGNAYKKIGDFEQSQTLLENAFDSYISELRDSTASDMIKPTLELARLHRERRGFEPAAHYYDRALSIVEINEISDPEITTGLYSGYGNTMSELGNPQLAIMHLNKALTTARTADLSDAYIRSVRTNLAQAYRSNHEYQKSETLYKEVLYSLPAEDPYTVDMSVIHNNLGFLMKVQGETEQALAHYNRSLEINRFVYGENHPNTKIILNNLSVLYASMERFDRAEEIRLDLLEINREDFGESHWRTGASYESLGKLKLQAEQLDSSSDFFERAIQIYSEALGDDHIWTERAILYYSLSRFNSNESQVAKSEFREAFQSLKEKRITFSRFDVNLMNNLIKDFKSYPSISSSPEFALLDAIR
ncbi:serine/threonine-protein kinase [Rhodohalobacter sp. 8-1]|uniref:serine/threonine-protein kinase n=1 Tax=Rhodohalobacter sp. 8-1 TaxID=3131972 RepID=UPI0030EBD946